IFVIFVSIFFIFLIPRLIYLGYDTYGFDSYFWDQRSDRFVDSVISLNFEKTYRSYHPGVTVMILSGTAKGIFQNAVKLVFGYNIRLVEGVVYARWFFINHFVSLFPLVTVISLILSIVCVGLYKLKVPLLYILFFAFFLSVEPFFLGISKFLHVTALETVLVFAFFMFIYFINENIKSKKIWVATGVILGLGLLTKISAIIVIPFGALILFFPILKSFKNKKIFLSETKNKILIMAVILITALVTCVVLWPSLWVNFAGTLTKIYQDGIRDDAFDATPAPTILNNRYLYYPEILLMRTTGLTFISFLISIFLVFKEKNKKLKEIIIINFLFVAYYFSIMSIPDKKLDRYINNVFPSVLMGASFTFYYIFMQLRIKGKKIISNVFIGVIIFYYMLNLYVYFPTFSAIHSDLFGGFAGYSKLARIKNRGEYYINAVIFINNKDGRKADTENLVIPQGGKDKSARGFPGKIFTDDKDVKSGKANYYLPDFQDLQEIPKDKNCELIQTFGPRWPLQFDYLYLYECQ
ncbi:hypothetical protein KA001_01920, partial [Patescibacteria group bacterium]|nr:hypothetical protein [Patescibacteria group bacterium]